MHTPIWRDETVIGEKFCKVSNLKNIIEELTKDLANVTVIDGFDLVRVKNATLLILYCILMIKTLNFITKTLQKRLKKRYRI